MSIKRKTFTSGQNVKLPFLRHYLVFLNNLIRDHTSTNTLTPKSKLEEICRSESIYMTQCFVTGGNIRSQQSMEIGLIQNLIAIAKNCTWISVSVCPLSKVIQRQRQLVKCANSTIKYQTNVSFYPAPPSTRVVLHGFWQYIKTHRHQQQRGWEQQILLVHVCSGIAFSKQMSNFANATGFR